MMRDYTIPYNVTAEDALKIFYRNMAIILKQAQSAEDSVEIERLMYDLRVCARNVSTLARVKPDAVVNPAPETAEG
jgi:hypothetical protein